MVIQSNIEFEALHSIEIMIPKFISEFIQTEDDIKIPD